MAVVISISVDPRICVRRGIASTAPERLGGVVAQIRTRLITKSSINAHFDSRNLESIRSINDH